MTGSAPNGAKVLEAYRAEVVNDAVGETSRFLAVYSEYVKAPEVTRKRMYLETMEGVLGRVNKVLLDGVTAGTNGVQPYLPLDQLIRPKPAAGTTGAAAAPATAQTGGN